MLRGTIWPECPEHRASRRLSTALWRLRQELEPPGTRPGAYVWATREHVGLAMAPSLTVDLDAFERPVMRTLSIAPAAMSAEDATALAAALDVRIAPLLVGWYDDWVLAERRRLDYLYIRGLRHLMRYYRAAGALEESIVCAERLLGQDPLQEEVHRVLMWLFLATGRAWAAIDQYARCCAALQHDLQLPPSHATQALFREACDSLLAVSARRAVSSATLRGTLCIIERELARLQEVRRQVVALLARSTAKPIQRRADAAVATNPDQLCLHGFSGPLRLRSRHHQLGLAALQSALTAASENAVRPRACRMANTRRVTGQTTHPLRTRATQIGATTCRAPPVQVTSSVSRPR